MLYKIVNEVVAIPSHPYFQQKLRSFRTHPLGLQPYLQPYQTNIYIQLFPKNNTNMEQLATSNPTGQLMLSKPASIALYSPQVTMPFFIPAQCTCCTLSAAVNIHKHCLFALFLSDRMAMVLITFLVIYNQSLPHLLWLK